MDGPGGATLKKRTFFSHERRSLPADDPNLNLRRRLADQRRYYSSDASQLDLQHEIDLLQEELKRDQDPGRMQLIQEMISVSLLELDCYVLSQ